MSRLRWMAPLLAAGFAVAAQAQGIDAAMKLKVDARTKALVEGARKEGEMMVNTMTW